MTHPTDFQIPGNELFQGMSKLFDTLEESKLVHREIANTVKELEKKQNNIQLIVSHLKQDYKNHSQTIVDIHTKFESIKETCHKLSTDILMLQQQFQIISKYMPQYKATVTKHTEMINQLNYTCTEYRTKISDMGVTIGELTKEVQELTTCKNNMNAIWGATKRISLIVASLVTLSGVLFGIYQILMTMNSKPQ